MLLCQHQMGRGSPGKDEEVREAACQFWMIRGEEGVKNPKLLMEFVSRIYRSPLRLGYIACVPLY